jgi:hypothetical protein
VKKTAFVIQLRAAVGDNGAFVLNIDGAAPGRMYACIDEATLEEITAQLAVRADTSNVIVPEREGYAVDVVTFNATLHELFTAEVLPFDHDTEIDAWVTELESLAQYLREFKNLSHVRAAGMMCANCPHSLLDHQRQDSADLKCQGQDCECRGFFPVEAKTLN